MQPISLKWANAHTKYFFVKNVHSVNCPHVIKSAKIISWNIGQNGRCLWLQFFLKKRKMGLFQAEAPNSCAHFDDFWELMVNKVIDSFKTFKPISWCWSSEFVGFSSSAFCKVVSTRAQTVWHVQIRHCLVPLCSTHHHHNHFTRLRVKRQYLVYDRTRTVRPNVRSTLSKVRFGHFDGKTPFFG